MKVYQLYFTQQLDPPPTLHTFSTRSYAACRACKWVTAVVEDAPYVTEMADLRKHEVDFVAHGDDMTTDLDGNDSYAAVKAAGMMKCAPSPPRPNLHPQRPCRTFTLVFDSLDQRTRFCIFLFQKTREVPGTLKWKTWHCRKMGAAQLWVVALEMVRLSGVAEHPCHLRGILVIWVASLWRGTIARFKSPQQMHKITDGL